MRLEEEEMKPAMTRTMDSQGRIIIPHEIRETMGLSSGDLLEIRTVENGLLLTKYHDIAIGDHSLKKYLTLLYSVIHCGVALCTTDQVITSKGLFLSDGAGISAILQSYICSEKEQIFTAPVYITDNPVFMADTLIPLSAPERFWQPCALVIVKGRHKITESERACARLIAKLISAPNEP